MKNPVRVVVAALAVSFSSVAAAQEGAVDTAPVSTEFPHTSCSQLAALSEQERAFSLIFYYGYMAGRSAATTVEDAAVAGHLASVRDYCNAHPDARVVEAFVSALK
jgi:hypothetical protein